MVPPLLNSNSYYAGNRNKYKKFLALPRSSLDGTVRVQAPPRRVLGGAWIPITLFAVQRVSLYCVDLL